MKFRPKIAPFNLCFFDDLIELALTFRIKKTEVDLEILAVSVA